MRRHGRLTETVVEAGAVITAMGLGALLWAERTGSRARLIAKPVASAGFLVVAVGAGALESDFGRWMAAALVLSALGDVLLLGEGDKAFLSGLGSFLTAHVLFAVSFAVRGLSVAVGSLAALPLLALALGVLRWLHPHLSARMRMPVIAYATAISVMGVLAVATTAAEPDLRIAAGAGLFIASDIAVARQAFVIPAFINRLWGLPAYYGGQLLLAWSAGG